MKNSKVLLSRLFSNVENLNFSKDNLHLDFSENKLVLLTNAGTLIGEPIIESTILDNEDCEPQEYISELIFSTIQNQLTNADDLDNPTLLLRNVTLYNAGKSFHYRYLYVFLNDIIGITRGSGCGFLLASLSIEMYNLIKR